MLERGNTKPTYPLGISKASPVHTSMYMPADPAGCVTDVAVKS